MSITFVFTNPGHHLEMMSPVIEELRRRGRATSLVSIAELRGLETPVQAPPIARAIPWRIRRHPGKVEGPGIEVQNWQRGAVMQDLVWRFALGPRLAWMLKDAQLVVIPNDIAFPYDRLLALRKRHGRKTALIQEGIRFVLPTRYTGPLYGTNGADLVCVWGEGSRDYFSGTGVAERTITVTGTPRMDGLDPPAWGAAGAVLLRELGLTRAPLAYLSNPIETQHFGPKQLRLQIFETFLRAALPILAARDLALVVKSHAGEDANEYRAIAAASARPDLIHVIPEARIFAVLAACRASIVLASTVGLESMLFERPVGVMQIPGHGYAFEYVERHAAVGLDGADPSRGLTELLDRAGRSADSDAFVERHIHDRGRAYRNVADALERLLAAT